MTVKREITVSKGWMAQHLNVKFDRRYYFDPCYRKEIDDVCQDAVDARLPGLNALFSESNLGRRAYYHAGNVLVGGIQPNLILGMLLGAEFLPADSRDADISPECWKDRRVEDLPDPGALLEHELIRKFDEQVAQVNRKPGFTAIPPFFWDTSGRPAIHGVLTTVQKFIGENVFADLMTGPGEAAGMMAWTADAFVALVSHFAARQAAGIEQIHIGECSACLVGPDLYAQQVMPVLDRIGAKLGPVRLHSCGQSDHLLEAFGRMKHLASLDLGGETSLVAVRKIFGKDFPVSMAPPVALLSSQDSAPVLAWVENVLHENDGGDLTFLLHVEAEYPPGTVAAFCRE